MTDQIEKNVEELKDAAGRLMFRVEDARQDMHDACQAVFGFTSILCHATDNAGDYNVQDIYDTLVALGNVLSRARAEELKAQNQLREDIAALLAQRVVDRFGRHAISSDDVSLREQARNDINALIEAIRRPKAATDQT